MSSSKISGEESGQGIILFKQAGQCWRQEVYVTHGPWGTRAWHWVLLGSVNASWLSAWQCWECVQKRYGVRQEARGADGSGFLTIIARLMEICLWRATLVSPEGLMKRCFPSRVFFLSLSIIRPPTHTWEQSPACGTLAALVMMPTFVLLYLFALPFVVNISLLHLQTFLLILKLQNGFNDSRLFYN